VKRLVHGDLVDWLRRPGRQAGVMIHAKIRRNPSMLRAMLHCGKNRGANGMQHRRGAEARFPPEMLAS
jgi:hypothetical protein